mmetsp:Transcript_37920/g.43675  ORF Transcript_37920/g.43675 Transcript_37920/m.43675 type:complete len:288 (+) Transcript_37920:103-966(+)
MAGCSSTSISSSPPSIVRKFTDSIVIGSQQMHQNQPCLLSSKPVHHQAVRDPQAQQNVQQLKNPRVVSCNFEIEIPTNALRIDMSILVSTNDNSSSSRSCCYETTGTTNLLPRPSVTYKITICTPRRQEAAAAVAHEEQGTTTTTKTTTTFRYSSKFTVAKDIDDNVVPYHEWNGSFALGAKQNTPLPLEDCSFHQVQGIFTANYDHDTDNDTNEEEGGDNINHCKEDQTSRKLKKSFNDIIDNDDDEENDFPIPPRKKQRHHNNTSNEKTKLNQQQQQRQQNRVVT